MTGELSDAVALGCAQAWLRDSLWESFDLLSELAGVVDELERAYECKPT